ncbi:zf-CCHC domain-containing protein [Tanacetum coccineum]
MPNVTIVCFTASPATAPDSLITTHQGNKQVKSLDESFSSRNHVRKFLRDLPSKWRSKVTAIEESKDLSKLSLDELVGNLKVYEIVLEKDLEIAKNKKENNDEEILHWCVRDFKKFFRRREQGLSDNLSLTTQEERFQKIKEDKKEERRCFKCGDPNHFICDCPKNFSGDQKAFVVGSWSDSGDDSKKEEICLMAHSNEVLSDDPYYSSSSLDNESRENKYDKLSQISLRIINKNKHLKTKNGLLKKTINELKTKLDVLEKGYTKTIASPRNTKIKNLGDQLKKLFIELACRCHSSTAPASSSEQHWLSDDSAEKGKELEANVRQKVKLDPDEWIQDSGCTRYMTENKDLFSSYKPFNGGNVLFGSNTKIKIIGEGLWYPKGTGLETIVYADSDHAGDYVDRKSTSGVCTFVIHFKKGIAKYVKVSSTHQKCFDLDSSSYFFQKIILL